MSQPGLDNRHRDKHGEISKKHGNTPASAPFGRFMALDLRGDFPTIRH